MSVGYKYIPEVSIPLWGLKKLFEMKGLSIRILSNGDFVVRQY